MIVNMGILMIGMSLLPLPGGVTFEDPEFATIFLSLDLKYFFTPWLAHAGGTLVGALIAAKMAISHQAKLAVIVGVLFFVGGALNFQNMESPTWFIILDLTLAYIPMGILGGKLAGAK